MSDPRITKLASILVHHSLGVKAGETVLINASSELAKPLVLEVYRELVKSGAHVLVNVALEETANIFFDHATPAQLTHLPKIKLYEAKNIDCVVVIRAAVNKKAFSTIDPARGGIRAKALRPISEVIVNKKRWILCNFPTNAGAQEAEMGLEEYEEFVYSATNVDWKALKRSELKLKRLLDRAKEVRITGRETDLTLSIQGRKAVMCYGERNMPDGEVFLSPVENSAEGYIYYDMPAIYQGREVGGVRLRFKAGKIIDASAEKNERYLISVLDTDKGARFLGEFGIGVNYSIKKFSKDILFDEKIGGTVHLAAGRSYERAGGKNSSAVHWDMIKDLRKGGAISLDGRVIQKNGKFVF